jgi:hypothetical protein
MKKLTVLILSAMLITACGAPRKLNFNTPQFLDQQVPNNTTKELKCGENFSANFTNTDSTFGTLDVNNLGSACNVNVVVTELTGGAGGTLVTKFAAGPGIGNIAAFPLSQNRQYNFRFECESSTMPGGCVFSYRFSRANEIPNATMPSPEIDLIKAMPKGPSTGNMCITEEQPVKIITNATKNQLGVIFTAKSTCKCQSFNVFGDPQRNNDKRASAGPDGVSDGGVVIPPGMSSTLKAKCEGIGLTSVQCSCNIEKITLTITK